MCYSGKCRFENWMGECQLYVGFKKFSDKYGYSACLVGGCGHESPEEEKSYNEHKEEIEDVYRRFLEDAKNERNKWSWIR